MLVDPCRGRGNNNDFCCDGANQGACQDFPIIESGTDMSVAWFVNGYILHCSDDYKNTKECGTYLEIHRPDDSRTIESVQIVRLYESGYATEFISTKKLCAGRYEVWFVSRTRNGRVLQHVKPFYSTGPSCTCEQIEDAGFSCTP